MGQMKSLAKLSAECHKSIRVSFVIDPNINIPQLLKPRLIHYALRNSLTNVQLK